MDTKDSTHQSTKSAENGANKPAECISQLLLDLISQKDADSIVESQRAMLDRFEKTNEMLVNCNALSLIRYELAAKNVRQGIQKLTEMKKDLEFVFKRIKLLKTKVADQYSNAYQIVRQEQESAATHEQKEKEIDTNNSSE